MKRKIIYVVIFTVVLCSLFTFTASADMGPKPSVKITFRNMSDDAVCYGTLLSYRESTGPASAWNGKEAPMYYVWDGDSVGERDDDASHKDIWQKMVDYQDSDGYYFLQRIWRVDLEKRLDWTYYPPEKFKILLYYPESDTFSVSGIHERYAFDSYFTVDMKNFVSGKNTLADNTQVLLNLEESYDYKWEIISLAARIVITVLIETLIALMFAYKSKRDFTLIFALNIVTQIILNVLLSIENYKEGYMAYTAYYILFEFIVLAIEGVAYTVLIKDKKKSRNILYAVTSNALSFAAGLLLSHIIPGIF